MKRILLAICMMAMSALSYGQSNRVSFTFAWLSDVHLNSFAYAEDDLRQSIEADSKSDTAKCSCERSCCHAGCAQCDNGNDGQAEEKCNLTDESSGRWIYLPFFKNLDDSLTDIPADHIPDNKYDNCFKKIDSPVESKIF